MMGNFDKVEIDNLDIVIHERVCGILSSDELAGSEGQVLAFVITLLKNNVN